MGKNVKFYFFVCEEILFMTPKERKIIFEKLENYSFKKFNGAIFITGSRFLDFFGFSISYSLQLM
jgi:hypothetical protein